MAAQLWITLALVAPAMLLPATPLAPAWDPDDATLLHLLARLDRPELERLPLPALASADALPGVAARLATRSGGELTDADIAGLATLDTRLAVPVATLLVTIEHSWTAIDAATAGLSEEDRIELFHLQRAGQAGSTRWNTLYSPVDEEALIQQAILLTDVAENLVLPLLQNLPPEAWPANGRWDSVGVLRIGTPGNDVENLDRILQLDPTGDDTYNNNAGASTIFRPLFDNNWNILTPIGISIDLAGDDTYWTDRLIGSQGSGDLGLGYGMLLELDGDDRYTCRTLCKGADLAVFRDYAGNDEHLTTPQAALGFGGPLALARDDAGDDVYRIGPGSGGFASVFQYTGLLWDRDGQDQYRTDGFPDERLGWGLAGGRGWFADEGPQHDYYQTAEWPDEPFKHGCNDCTWTRGSHFTASIPANGHGNDNSGGLAHMIAKQDSTITLLRP